jgi:hypothetical protein
MRVTGWHLQGGVSSLKGGFRMALVSPQWALKASWRRSARCGKTDCVEVAVITSTEKIRRSRSISELMPSEALSTLKHDEISGNIDRW